MANPAPIDAGYPKMIYLGVIMKPEPQESSAAPLAPAAFYILFALADGDKHGYAIMQETAKLSDGKFRMGPATLYTNVQRLLAAEFIREVAAVSGPSDKDGRRRYYRLARAGKLALEEELDRMRQVLRRAQSLAFALKPR